MQWTIRRLESAAELAECVEIQIRVWGLKGEETVSAPILETCLDHGALLIGAFRNELLAGFCFSLPSFWKGSVPHHSHMLAVLPESRDQGIGYRLKNAQFEALKNHCRWITWTFDPLESRNARLNLKLGVSMDTYIRDLYGDGESCTLHQGIGTDRFIAEWPTSPTRNPRAQKLPLPQASTPRLIETEWDDRGFFKPLESILDRTEKRLYLEIPADIQEIKTTCPNCAREWRLATRTALEHYFEKGYAVKDFLTFIDSQTGTRRSFYILSHGQGATS